MESARALLKRVSTRCSDRRRRTVSPACLARHVWQRIAGNGTVTVAIVCLVALPTERSNGMPPVGTNSVFSPTAKDEMCTRLVWSNRSVAIALSAREKHVCSDRSICGTGRRRESVSYVARLEPTDPLKGMPPVGGAELWSAVSKVCLESWPLER